MDERRQRSVGAAERNEAEGEHRAHHTEKEKQTRRDLPVSAVPPGGRWTFPDVKHYAQPTKNGHPPASSTHLHQKRKIPGSPLQGVWGTMKKQPRVMKKKRENLIGAAAEDPFTIRGVPLRSAATVAPSPARERWNFPKVLKKPNSAPSTSVSWHNDVPCAIPRRRPKGLRLDLDLVRKGEVPDRAQRFRKRPGHNRSGSTATSAASSDAQTISEIGENVFISGSVPASDPKRLRDRSITHVINCCAHRHPSPKAIADEFVLLGLSLNDSSVSDLVAVMYATIDFIEQAKATRKDCKILIHCLKGISRSASLAAAYLMWKRGIDAFQALREIRKARPSVDPNADFLVQLTEWGRYRPLVAPESCFLYRVETLNNDDHSDAKHPPARVVGPVMGKRLADLVRRMKSGDVGDAEDEATDLLLCTPLALYVRIGSTRVTNRSAADASHIAVSMRCARIARMRTAIAYFKRYEGCDETREVRWIANDNETASTSAVRERRKSWNAEWLSALQACDVNDVLTPRLQNISIAAAWGGDARGADKTKMAQ
eukprot:g915.t1